MTVDAEGIRMETTAIVVGTGAWYARR